MDRSARGGSAACARFKDRHASADGARSLHANEPVAHYLARFYYDLAGPRTEDALQALLGIAEPPRLLYGSDWPFTPAQAVTHLFRLLSRTSVLDAAQLEAMMSGNARRFLR